ncbi:MAG: hypothetical protein Q8Q59_08400 [Luteolibacter sp.]|nr:hypothetical protein [Luteolibacter sp.]
MTTKLKKRAFVGGAEVGQVFFGGEEVEFAFGMGTQLMPHAGIYLEGFSSARVVADAGEKWFEFGFCLDMTGMGGGLAGNSGAGWTDPGNYLLLEAQWSPDLINWSMGKFVPAPVPVVDLGAGVFEYWSRALNPQDSAVKTGALVVSRTNGDVRNNPFTSLVIAGVAQALPHFPYDMAVTGTAAQLQGDLEDLGWIGAIVTGSSRATWSISIPSVNYTSYSQTSRVGFPVYLVADMFGAINTPVDHIGFRGSFLDAAGTAIFPKAFARLKISPGTRYNPYL